MKVHIISNLFWPDELAGASLYSDLAKYLHERGIDVRVTTTFPYYPDWKLKDEDLGKICRTDSWNGILLRRVKMFVPQKPTGLKRLLSDFTFLLSLCIFGRFKNWKPDIVFTASPMVSQCLAVRILYSNSIPSVFVVQDFVAAAAKELGIIKLPGMSVMLTLLEKYALERASVLATINDKMLLKLVSLMEDNRNCVEIPNWLHLIFDEFLPEKSKSKKSCSLLYSGNLGVKQGLPQFAEDFLEIESGWKLDINGGGVELTTLSRVLSGKDSISLGGVLDIDDYISALSKCSAFVITQQSTVEANYLPSKLLPALATGCAVLAICDLNSPLGQEVLTGGFGVVVAPGDRGALRSILAKWKHDPCELDWFRKKSILHSQRFSRDKILGKYIKLFSSLISMELESNI